MDKTGFLIVSFVLLVIVVNLWWLPQKWQACGKLHDNTFAQMMCFTGE